MNIPTSRFNKKTPFSSPLHFHLRGSVLLSYLKVTPTHKYSPLSELQKPSKLIFSSSLLMRKWIAWHMFHLTSFHSELHLHLQQPYQCPMHLINLSSLFKLFKPFDSVHLFWNFCLLFTGQYSLLASSYPHGYFLHLPHTTIYSLPQIPLLSLYSNMLHPQPNWLQPLGHHAY